MARQTNKVAGASFGVAGAITLLILNIYPPQNPFWPYFAYTLVIPGSWVTAILLQKPARDFLSERYDNLRAVRVPITALIVFVFVILGGVWMRYLPPPPGAQGRYAPQPDSQPTPAVDRVTTIVAVPAPGSPPTLTSPNPMPPVKEEPTLKLPGATVQEPPAAKARQSIPPSEVLAGNRCDVLARLIPIGRTLDDRCRSTDCANETDVKQWTDAALTHVRQNFPTAIIVAFENPPQQGWVVNDFPAAGPKLRMLHDLNWRWPYLIRVIGSPACSA
jgi:hypothetical protein